MREEQPILSISIPTYNRANDLNHNLTLIESYLGKAGLFDKVCLVISNNCSTDETDVVIKHYEDEGKICIHYYKQEHNIGAGPNQVYAVEKASTPWVMLLGDDDYLEPWYIEECLKQIEEHPNLGCIIPNYMDYYPATGEYRHLREENCETQYYNAGFDACLQNAWRAHQLSGLCFRRENVIEEFHKRGINNLYPQIFFVSYNALRYDVLHWGQKCLCVSGVPQSKKDWRYGDDGLVNDIFDNFKHLGVTRKQRAILEAHFLYVDKRYFWATNDTNLCIEKILTGKNVSYLGRYYIAKQILHERCYTGKCLRFMFYMLARIELLRKLLTGKPIQL